MEQLQELLVTQTQVRRLAVITLAFLAAYIIHLFSWRLTGRLINLNRFAIEGRRLRQERKNTVHGLVANTLSLLVFIIAILISLGQFIEAETLVWMVGLFSAAFGFSVRPLLSDFLAGISFIFEDTFDVGEKVELMEVEGVIERVTLRATLLRAPTGELYVVPNGDIRLIRNFSRGRFSSVTIKVKVASEELGRALTVLEALGEQAVVELPNLLEPWQILSETGAIGESAELTLMSKARFGRAAEMRPRLLAFVQERLSEAGITLSD
ncbi:MAG: mechanosensitive ion channel family protein [Candidatus Promineifilaceae bacterium]|nr:mechanosensitive ion channel family protein [Candidatus Promineifilaceae bacterium]